MPMSDELGSAVVNISTTVVQSGINTVTNLISDILKMIQSGIEHKNRMKEAKLKSGIDISDLKPGQVKLKDLIRDARNNGDSISFPTNAYSKEDADKIAGLAKKYGIPVAFTERGDGMYAQVRTSDTPIFKQLLTEHMQNKLTAHSQDLSNFKVNAWEIPYLTAELNNYNLNASFGQTKGGDYFCMYDKADEKAILIARGEFFKKYNEVKNDLIIDKDEEGFYTLKDLKTGKEITFDDSKKSCNELSYEMQIEFGYDLNKADIAAARFGEECLEGEVKENYFENPQNDTHSIINNIALESDDIYAQQYSCMRVVPKEDSIQRVVFSDKDGRFAVLNPEMNRHDMEEELRMQLEISDKKEIDSLIGKAENVMLYYAKQEDQTRYYSEYTFSKNDFNMKNSDVVMGMKREEGNHIYTRELPLDNLSINIERDGKNRFIVTSDARHIEINERQHYSTFTETRKANLSFADKKKAVHQLQQMFVDQGVPEGIAKRAAFDTFAKAASQETEKVIYLDEVKSENPVRFSDNLKVEAEIYCAGKSASIDMSDATLGRQQIIDTFGVTEEKASDIFERTGDKITEKQQNLLHNQFGYECEDWSISEASFVIGKLQDNNWEIPEGMEPSSFSIDSIRGLNMEKAPAALPDINIDAGDLEEVVSIGGR